MTAHAEAKAECEKLMNAAIPFAEHMLAKYGEFFPFGIALDNAGKVVRIDVQESDDGTKRPQTAVWLARFDQAFMAGARDGKYRATCLVSDVRANLPGSADKSDAIHIGLEHRDNFAVEVLIPYVIRKDKPVLAKPVAQAREPRIFSPPSNPTS